VKNRPQRAGSFVSPRRLIDDPQTCLRYVAIEREFVRSTLKVDEALLE
jgi:hypothetical protein